MNRSPGRGPGQLQHFACRTFGLGSSCWVLRKFWKTGDTLLLRSWMININHISQWLIIMTISRMTKVHHWWADPRPEPWGNHLYFPRWIYWTYDDISINKEAINALTFLQRKKVAKKTGFASESPDLPCTDMTSVMCTCKYCKSCDACSGHSLTVSYKHSMSWLEFLNLWGIVNCATRSLNH